jgi:hypothetical protein
MRGTRKGGRYIPGTDSAAWMPFEACSDGRRALAATINGGNLYGSRPSVEGFVATTAQVRSWSKAEAVELAHSPAPPEVIEQLMKRLQTMVESVVQSSWAVRLVMDRVYGGLGIRDMDNVAALRVRQRLFLAAARAVASGQSSRYHLRAFGRPPTELQATAGATQTDFASGRCVAEPPGRQRHVGEVGHVPPGHGTDPRRRSGRRHEKFRARFQIS